MTKVQYISDHIDAKIVAEIRGLLELEESAPQRAIRLGELFTERKAAVGHGNWLPWLEANEFPNETANRYMRVWQAANSSSTTSLDEPIEKLAARAPSQRKRNPPKPKTTYGWISALQTFSGLSMQFGGSQGRTLSKQVGYDVTKQEYSEDEARDLAAQAVLCFAEPPPRGELTKTEESLVQKAIRQEIAQLRKGAAAEIQAEVDKRMVAVLADYKKWTDEAKAEKEHYEAAAKLLPDWMTYEDFQVVISCLHPDRAPAGLEERYRKAFQIMNALKKRFK